MDTPRINRRLAAILAADVVGYSRLMAEDDAGTLAALNRLRKTRFAPFVSRHDGRIVKLMGDGALVAFGSAIAAVDCAMEIQRALAADADARPAIVLRIGINLGDIILQGDDIFGDGVNIAARLEQLARPGGICISSVVRESLGARTGELFEGGGAVSVKNIDRPLRVFHWQPDGAVAESPGQNGRVAEPAPGPASVAVLPFDNMSGDPDQQFFSDGISEDIITDLSKIAGLTVIARNSSFVYRGKSVDLRQVGRELGVGHVLEGSVRRAGNRVRITAQLIDAATGGHVWAERYDRDLNDIFAVQDEVTLEIVNALKVRLTAAERAGIADVGTSNMEAHENFMRIRSFLSFPGMEKEIWQRAMAAGERAIELDPGYADAHAMLAIMQVFDIHNRWTGRSPQAVLDSAGQMARRARDLAPEGILPNEAVAVVAFWSGELDQAHAAVQKVLAKSPDFSLAHFTRGEVRLGLGRFQDAIGDFERAIRLDPAFGHQYLQFLGMAHFQLEHFETAALMFRERLVLVPGTDIGRAWLTATLGQLGEVAEARQVWADLLAINPGFDTQARMGRLAFGNPTSLARIMDGLAAAGLP